MADIGGTHARFALVDDAPDPNRGALVSVKVFKCADFNDAAETVLAYQDFIGGELPSRACIAAAGPVDNGEVEFTNLNWHLSACELQKTLHLQKLEIVNDFTAMAYSVVDLDEKDVCTVYSGDGQEREGTRVVLGAGTGLGVAALTAGDQFVVLESEGGHKRFAPATTTEIKLLAILLRQHDFVSMEMLLSGPGITLLYKALAELNGVTPQDLDSKTITANALNRLDPLCNETMTMYCQILAGFCTDAALNFNAKGGIYLVGDIFRSIEPLLSCDIFRERYLHGGRMKSHLAKTPVSLVLVEDPGLRGAAFRAMNS